ncbi:MAG TPA: hypothetical protein VFY29_07720 [Terriglobia bacterium]|nr:hypothetical protein [Terriglobia bacterium]
MDVYFLLFSLLFPRTVLVIYLLFFPNLFPPNSVPQWAEILLGVVLPRMLILLYISENMGVNNVWFAAHLLMMILTYLGGSRATRRRRMRTGD